MQDHTSKITKAKNELRSMAQVVKHLPSKQKSLSSNTSTISPKKEKRKPNKRKFDNLSLKTL
jgi:hypothetical protein